MHGHRPGARETGRSSSPCNHIGVADGPLLAAFAPRPVHALTKYEMFAGKLGGFLHGSGQIPLDRFHTDPAAVKSCLRVLRDGRAVGIFPEGRRGTGDLERFHRGAAYFALVSGAPVVPVAILGTREPGGHTNSLPAARRRRATSSSARRTRCERPPGRAPGNKSSSRRCCYGSTCWSTWTTRAR